MRRRKAAQLYEDALHQTMIRGPEGESETFEKGKRVKGDTKVTYKGYQAWLESLRWTAEGIAPEIQEIMKTMNEVDAVMGKLQNLFGRLNG